MPILTNPRHELFAQELAKGESAHQSYINAGFKPSRQNASRLRANEGVSARVLELQQAGAKSAEISVASLIEELEAARIRATSLNQLSAAVRATAEKAKISGLLTQKVEMTVSQEPDHDRAETAEEILVGVVEDLGMKAALALAAAFELPFDEAAIRALCNGSQAPEQARRVARAIEWKPPKSDRGPLPLHRKTAEPVKS